MGRYYNGSAANLLFLEPYLENLPNTKTHLQSLLSLPCEHEKWQTVMKFALSDTLEIDVALWCLRDRVTQKAGHIEVRDMCELHKETLSLAEQISESSAARIIDKFIGSHFITGYPKTLHEALQMTVCCNKDNYLTILRYPVFFRSTMRRMCFVWFSQQIAYMKENLNYTKEQADGFTYESMDMLISFDLRKIRSFLDNVTDKDEMEAMFNFLGDLQNSQWTRSQCASFSSARDYKNSVILLHAQFVWHCVTDRAKEVFTDHRCFVHFKALVFLLIPDCKWSLANIWRVLNEIADNGKKIEVLRLLKLSHEHKMACEDFLSVILSPGSTTSWPKKLHAAFVQKYLNNARKYNPEEIMQHIYDEADIDPSSMLTKTEMYGLYNDHQSAMERMRCKSVKVVEFRRADHFDLSDPLAAAETVFGSLFTGLSLLEPIREEKIRKDNYFSTSDRVAIAVTAINRYFNTELREVQIFAILLAMNARKKDQGRLMQVQTGEGKTFIVAAIAIAEALNGVKVDVITSSSELATLQQKKLEGLFKSVGLESATNCHNASYDNTNLYDADIVYGTESDFMGDILRDEGRRESKRCRKYRGYQLAIIDEVDNMLLDNCSTSLRLSGRTPGMNDLLSILPFIWQTMQTIKQDTKLINNVWHYGASEKEMLPIDQGLSIVQFAADPTLTHMRKMLGFEALTAEEMGSADDKKKMEYHKIDVPAYLSDFVETQLPFWVESAARAMFVYERDRDYTLFDHKVVIVDTENTGVLQSNSTWGQGLHQFLQMKHGCYLTPLSLTSTCLSNLNFFKLYKKNILGLTGTIGGEACRKFLRDTYSVDFVDIPPFMQRQHCELMSVWNHSDIHIRELDLIIQRHVEAGRALLIIARSIKEAKAIHSQLLKTLRRNRVHMYTGCEKTDFLHRELEPGECVVATNIAGRGTDLSVSNEVEESGGLHVILTFIPENERVERQNVGRTSRSGHRGTSQFVISSVPSLLNRDAHLMTNMNLTDNFSVKNLRKARDQCRMSKLEEAALELQSILRRDEATRKFISISNSKLNNCDNVIEHHCRSSLKFGFSLYVMKKTDATAEDIAKEFEGIDSNNLINNPSDACKAAQRYSEKKDFEKGRLLLNAAIEKAGIFASPAYYLRGARDVTRYKEKKRDTDYLDFAMDDFRKSRKGMAERKERYEIMLHNLMFGKTETQEETETAESQEQSERSKDRKTTPARKTELMAQLERLITVTSAVIANIDVLIGRSIDDDLKQLRQLISESKHSEETSNLKAKESELLSQREVIEKGVLRTVMSKRADVKITTVPLRKILPSMEKSDFFSREIETFDEDGWGKFIIVDERKPIRWGSLMAVVGIGLMQIVGGVSAALFSLGAGAAVGLSLLQEGIGDLIHAVKDGVFTRNFSWKQYGIRKAISVAISCAMFGFAAIKNAAKGMVAGLKTGARIVTETTKQLAKDAFKQATNLIISSAATEVTKLVVVETLDYAMKHTVQPCIDNVLREAAKEALAAIFGDNKNLQRLLDCDQHNQNNAYAEEFSNLVMSRLEGNALVSQLMAGGQVAINAYLKRTGYGSHANALQKIWKTTEVVIAIKDVIYDLPSNLQTIVDNNLSEIVRIEDERREQKDEPLDDDKVYAEEATITVEEFMERLAGKIADKFGGMLTNSLSHYAAARAADAVHDHCSFFRQVDQDVADFRTKFVESATIVEDMCEILADKEKEDRRIGAAYIIGVAEDRPGDIIQAEHLAKVVDHPIHIFGKDANGKIIINEIFGRECGKEVIEVIYTEGVNRGIGHYSLKDGTRVEISGKDSCLIDAISKKTGHRPSELRKATANLLRHDTNFWAKIPSLNFAELCVGGRASLPSGNANLSATAVRHFSDVETVQDVLTKTDEAAKHRKKIVPLDTIVQEDTKRADEVMKRKFHDKSLAKNKNGEPLLVIDNRNMFDVTRHPYTCLRYYRGAVVVVLGQSGGVHLAKTTDEKNPQMTKGPKGVLIWTNEPRHKMNYPAFTSLDFLIEMATQTGK